MQIVCVQHEIAWEDKPATHQRVERLLSGATIASGSLIILPEMFATGFSLDLDVIDEGDEKPTEHFLAGLARKFNATVVGGVVNRAADGRGMNQALAFGPAGDELTRYTKLHPFSFASESEYFASGDKVVQFTCGEFTVCPLICYDLRFPEAFRHGAINGANLFCVIANWPTPRVSHWTALLRARAIENQAYVVGVNRCGSDPKLEYPGCSVVFDPKGSVLAEARGEEQVIIAQLDMAELTRYREKFSALRDIHPGLLGR